MKNNTRIHVNISINSVEQADDDLSLSLSRNAGTATTEQTLRDLCDEAVKRLLKQDDKKSDDEPAPAAAPAPAEPEPEKPDNPFQNPFRKRDKDSVKDVPTKPDDGTL